MDDLALFRGGIFFVVVDFILGALIEILNIINARALLIY